MPEDVLAIGRHPYLPDPILAAGGIGRAGGVQIGLTGGAVGTPDGQDRRRRSPFRGDAVLYASEATTAGSVVWLVAVLWVVVGLLVVFVSAPVSVLRAPGLSGAARAL